MKLSTWIRLLCLNEYRTGVCARATLTRCFPHPFLRLGPSANQKRFLPHWHRLKGEEVGREKILFTSEKRPAQPNGGEEEKGGRGAWPYFFHEALARAQIRSGRGCCSKPPEVGRAFVKCKWAPLAQSYATDGRGYLRPLPYKGSWPSSAARHFVLPKRGERRKSLPRGSREGGGWKEEEKRAKTRPGVRRPGGGPDGEILPAADPQQSLLCPREGRK